VRVAADIVRVTASIVRVAGMVRVVCMVRVAAVIVRVAAVAFDFADVASLDECRDVRAARVCDAADRRAFDPIAKLGDAPNLAAAHDG
jgi:hypothetical protein